MIAGISAGLQGRDLRQNRRTLAGLLIAAPWISWRYDVYIAVAPKEN